MILAILREFGLLSLQETEEFLTQFAKYLKSNGIDQETWDELSRSDADTANTILHLFTARAMGQVLDRISWLELRTPELATFMRSGDQGFRMITVAGSPSDGDLRSDELVFGVLGGNAVVSHRPFVHDRSNDLLDLVIRGFRPCSGSTNAILEKLSETIRR